MINLKTVFVLALLTTATSVSADEFAIDTIDLHATIATDLAEGMEMMQQNLNEDMTSMLIATDQAAEATANVTRSE
ncbi:hypothetical protein FM037_20690 [Shewanella psychropiezotolerans]|uniref:Uncharacterized protein n=1 Tax=Shewanella psychropiezotolerans TaxID=2593655 RepID=A0ABX5X5N8_9GAMM|nr:MULTISPECIES: hypothetical protein [Shewanella]MPY21115.1 hypothetical protein [Shewanella sp. YLB-07]MPY21902.1 hypothetical protein [Shewanella sp. YLB-07]QDO85213.1 hypothetical protein FM037_20690 [Shewanella psychropiezotolerans]